MLDRLKFHFERELRELEQSIQEFHQGNLEKVFPMSGSIHRLVFDKGRTSSILTQLNLKGELRFDRSYEAGFSNYGFPTLSIMAGHDTVYACSPKFKNSGSGIEFEEWWAAEIVSGFSTVRLRRSELILTMRDQDGGGHVDAKISLTAYEQLYRSGMPQVDWANTKKGTRLNFHNFDKTETVHIIREKPAKNELSPCDTGQTQSIDVIAPLVCQSAEELVEACRQLR